MVRGWRQPNRTPIVSVDGNEYAVDFETQTFERTGRGAKGPLLVRFDSPVGRRIWSECMILKCQRCGEMTVELRYLNEVRCDVCGAWLAV
jgi:hypothetical protein